MNEKFLGYCFDKNGRYCSPVTLCGVQEVKTYVTLQKGLHWEVRIVDSDDMTVMQAVNGEIVFPSQEGCHQCDANCDNPCK